MPAGLSHAGEPIVIGRTSQIHSKILSEDRTLRIFLRQSYEWAADRRHPILYLLDAEKHKDPNRAVIAEHAKKIHARLSESSD